MISGWKTRWPTFCWIQLSSRQFRNSSWLVRIHSLTCCKICVKHQKAVMVELFTTCLRSSATYMAQTFRQPSSWSKTLDWNWWHGRGAKRSLATILQAENSRNRVCWHVTGNKSGDGNYMTYDTSNSNATWYELLGNPKGRVGCAYQDLVQHQGDARVLRQQAAPWARTHEKID